MSYPRSYNAAADMVDRHVAEGRAGKPAFIDPARRAQLRRACGGHRPDGQPARFVRHPARGAASRCCCSTPSTSRSRSGAPSRPGVIPVALNTLLTANSTSTSWRTAARRCCSFRRRCCRWCGRSWASCRSSPTSSSRATRRPTYGFLLAKELASRPDTCNVADTCADEVAVLALLLRLDRHAEGRASRAFKPDGHGATLRPGRARHPRGRRRASRRRSCSSPTASATRMTFPMSVGATAVLLRRAADAGSRVSRR